MEYLLLFLIGIIAGFFSGTFGVGGGFIVVPMLYAVMGLPPEVVVSTSAFQMVGTSFSGAITHVFNKNIKYKAVFYLALPALVSSYFGVYLTKFLAQDEKIAFNNIGISQSDVVLTSILVILFLSMGVFSITQAKRTLPGINAASGKKKHAGVIYYAAVGLLAGFCPAMLGLGGGFIMVPFLMYFVGFTPVQSAAASLGQIFFISAASTFFYFQAGQFHPYYVAAILFGSIPAASFFAHRSKKYSPEKVKVGFGILCLLAMLIQITGFVRKIF
ncbi:MAG: sulfite exporter TauE/SafE family protein [Candidatus Aureabacteria bacterium]|nr:sulfite exporter TauE/SafE family protein [Candidatus Auribacterota bacterium]